MSGGGCGETPDLLYTFTLDIRIQIPVSRLLATSKRQTGIPYSGKISQKNILQFRDQTNISQY